MGNVMVIPAKRQIGNTGRKQDAKPKNRRTKPSQP